MIAHEVPKKREDKTAIRLLSIGALCIGLTVWSGGLIALEEAQDFLEDKTRLLLA